MMQSTPCEGRERKQTAIDSSTYTCAVGAVVRQKYAASSFPPTYLKIHEVKEAVM